jgi:tRNA threonylcarbamoyladenosine biosynthesis protein TsaE
MGHDAAWQALLHEAATERWLDLAGLEAWGQRLGALLPHGGVVALHGDLGAGKTTLVRAMAVGLGVADLDAVTSPTYALVHEYETALGPVLHADLYRVRRPEELEQLGWDDALRAARAALVEWPEQVPGALPADAWHVALAHVPARPDVRAVRVRGGPPRV